MSTISLRPVEAERDFQRMAALYSLEGEPTSEAAVREDAAAYRDLTIAMLAAVDDREELLGFGWAWRARGDETMARFNLIVDPQRRGQGAGSRLYDALEAAARSVGAKKLRVNLRDDCPPYRAFAERRGFFERNHSIAMALDLTTLDDRPYDTLIEEKRAEGFRFTSMAELGDSTEDQRRLYELNDTASSQTPGSEGEHSWASFADFQNSVCRSDWYHPDGQFVVIDQASGDWVAMSAITRFTGTEYAYNLFTGVDQRYRGRKLAQAVKILALRYAREVLGVTRVQTHHNAVNLPIIAIDRKFGYVQTPGSYLMEKDLSAG